MNESITHAALRRDTALKQAPTDLGRLPDRIRGLAQFWGGATREARPLSELVRRDGNIEEVEALRASMSKIHDPEIRAELLDWLGARLRAASAG